MKRKFIMAALIALLAGSFGVADAHRCDDTDDPETCEETEVMPNWRDGNYVPLFDLEDRDDKEQRKDAQRWREECSSGDPKDEDYESRQLCFWAYGGSSLFPNRGSDPTDPNSYSPNELHVGFAATHCFLQEAAHQCEDHNNGEGTHDAHGGAIYADICLTENPDSKYCDDGLKDTQVGVTIMDHNPCGTFVPVVACTDEYHVIRPFDTEYTQHQMEDSIEYIQRIAQDPQLYLCGYPEYSVGHPFCPNSGDAPAPDFGSHGASFRGPHGAGSDASGSAAGAGAMRGGERLLAGATSPFGSNAAGSTSSDGATLGLIVLIGLAVVVRARRFAFLR